MLIDSGIKQHGAIRFRIHVIDNFTHIYILILQSTVSMHQINTSDKLEV